MKIAIYSRRSKLSDSGDSILYQDAMCAERARGMFPGAELAFYEDEGFSGGSANRPMFKRLIQDVENGEIAAVVCYRLDRLSRSISDFTATLELLERHKVSFISVTESFDTSAPMGRAMLYIASVFAQLERDTTAQRIKDSFTELAKTGRRLTGRPPEGFCQKRAADKDHREYCVLEVNPSEASKIRNVYDIYIKYKSLSAAVKKCGEEGILTRAGKPVKADWLRRVLRHPAYAPAEEEVKAYLESKGAVSAKGCVFDGRTGLSAYRLKSGKPILAPGIHDYIIESEKWLEAQRILDGNRNNNRGGPGALRGLLRCGLCGSPMRPAGIRNDGWFSYVCARKDGQGRAACRLPNLSRDADEAVLKAVREEFLNGDDGAAFTALPVKAACHVMKTAVKTITWDGKVINIELFGG